MDLNPGKQMIVPLYFDFLVDAPDSGTLHLSIGVAGKSVPQNALLNGLEILKLNNSFLSLAGPFGLLDTGSSSHGNKHLLAILLFSILGILLLLLVIAAVFLLRCLRRRQQRRGIPEPVQKEIAAPSWTNLKSGSGPENSVLLSASTKSIDRLNLGLQISFADILFATTNFDENLIVGGIGLGKVYRGVLPDGTKVAVKRGMPGHRQGFPEFQTEIVVLSSIRHRRRRFSLP